jgi:hypothetical protein
MVEINPAGKTLWAEILGTAPDLSSLDKTQAWDPETGRSLRAFRKMNALKR